MRRVAVVVARVGSHPRLRPGLAVHRHAGEEPHALEAAACPGCDTENSDSSRWPRTDRRSRRRRSRSRRRRSRRRGPVGEAVRLGGVREAAISDVLEEEIGLAGKPGRSDHDARPVAPDERPLRADDRIPGRLDVARDIQVEVAVGIRVEERAAGAPTAGGDSGPRGHLLERAVAAVAEQEVRAPVGDVEIETPVVVDVTGAHAVAPRRGIHSRLLRHVLELPSAEVAIRGRCDGECARASA